MSKRLTQAETNHLIGEGHSVAAWLTVIIISIAATVVAAGMMAQSMPTIVIGIILIVVGLVVGRLMGMAGYGSKPPAPRQPLEL